VDVAVRVMATVAKGSDPGLVEGVGGWCQIALAHWVDNESVWLLVDGFP
jgi:hypothetical protein